MIGENFFANCWYSGCSLIVHGMKYILFLFLCAVGCACSMSGMGPGLVSMSPLRRSRRCSKSFFLYGMFFLFFCVLYWCLVCFMGIKFVLEFICCVCVFFCMFYVDFCLCVCT